MIFAPVRLGETSLNAEAVAADKKSCKRFGPCGVGKEALFLNSYFIDRRYYVAFSSVRRVFKRVAMSQGGFSGQGVFGAIPYLVVQYDGGKEKQCTFKREEDVDAMLAYIGEVHPEIPTLSVGGEQRGYLGGQRLYLGGVLRYPSREQPNGAVLAGDGRRVRPA